MGDRDTKECRSTTRVRSRNKHEETGHECFPVGQLSSGTRVIGQVIKRRYQRLEAGRSGTDHKKMGANT